MSDDTIPGAKSTSMASFPVVGAVVHGDDAKSNDEPMSEKQAARLRQLCEKHDEPFDGNLTKWQADARISALEKG